MRQGIVGFIILILGMAILTIIFVITQTKVIEKGVSTKNNTEEIQKNVNELQEKIQKDQNNLLNQNP